MPNPDAKVRDEEKPNPDIMSPEEEERWNWLDQQHAQNAAKNREAFDRSFNGKESK